MRITALFSISKTFINKTSFCGINENLIFDVLIKIIFENKLT